MSGDLVYLLRLGVPVEEIARRAGRTTAAIEHELRQHADKAERGHQ